MEAVALMEMASGGTSPSRQGAGTETSVPRNSSVAAAELRNSFWKSDRGLKFFRPEASYRRRGVVRRGPGESHDRGARPGARPRPLMVMLKGICPRGNNKVVINIFHVYDKCLFLMLELY